MTSAKRRRKQNRASAPRVIGANDNVQTANDNELISVGGVALSKRLSGVYRQAELDLASADPARKREGVQALVEIGLAIEAEHEAKHMNAVWAEITRLENGRGGRLSVERVRDNRGKEGEIYRVSRDGLESLSASLTPRQKTAGLRFRADYEMIDPERLLTPPALDRGARSSHGGEGWDKKRREIEERIWAVYLRIAGLPLPTHERRSAMPNLPEGHPVRRAIYALNEIAGKGQNPHEMTASGGARARLVASLVVGLDCAAIVYEIGGDEHPLDAGRRTCAED